MKIGDLELLGKIDIETYEAIKRCLCPYCDVGLPFTLVSGIRGVSGWEENRWTHSIPGAGETFECLASRFRNARPVKEKEGDS